MWVEELYPLFDIEFAWCYLPLLGDRSRMAKNPYLADVLIVRRISLTFEIYMPLVCAFLPELAHRYVNDDYALPKEIHFSPKHSLHLIAKSSWTIDIIVQCSWRYIFLVTGITLMAAFKVFYFHWDRIRVYRVWTISFSLLGFVRI